MISTERRIELRENHDAETNDEETEEWRDGLTDEERALVTEWDKRYENGIYSLCKAILYAERKNRELRADKAKQ
jgi:hypothetical protein